MDDDHSFIFNFWLNVPAKLINLQKLQLDLGQSIKIIIFFFKLYSSFKQKTKLDYFTCSSNLRP